MTYWPWWAGALALGTIAAVYYRALGRPLGASGAFGRLLELRAERKRAELEARLGDDEAKAAEALRAATLEAFGEQALAQGASVADVDVPKAPPPAASKRLPVSVHAVFLAMVAVGGALAGLLRGRQAGFSLDAALLTTYGGVAQASAALALGGFLVGFGTRMSGGCTSGHGLSGCSRLRPASLSATATFLGVAVAVTLLWNKVLS
ncbi:MAG: YeeE/YedE family protein [Myxococcota bacterium]